MTTSPDVETIQPKEETTDVKIGPNRVKAGRMAEIGVRTDTGYLTDLQVPWAALPSRAALGRHIRITNPQNDRSTIAWVAHVGPWFEFDDSYVFGGQRPQAETRKKDDLGRLMNGSGISLGHWCWKDLRLEAGDLVEWEFVS